MTFNPKHWEIQQQQQRPNEQLMMEDDDQDIYISERTSIASSTEMNEILTPVGDRSPTPPVILKKQVHTHRNHLSEIPENILPIVTHAPYHHHQHQQQKDENKKKKNARKNNSNDHFGLVTFPETKSHDVGETYYPSWYCQKVKNADRNVRHRQPMDHHQISPRESIDHSQNGHQQPLTTLPIKPRQAKARKTRPNQPNQDKQRFDHSENNSIISTHSTSRENHDNNHQKARTIPKQNLPLKDFDHDEPRIQPTKRTNAQPQPQPQPRRKVKNEHESIEKSSQDSNNGLIITSNSLTNRLKNRTKISDKSSVLSDSDDNNNKHRNQHYHHPLHPPPPHHQNHIQTHNSPSIPSHQPHQQTHIRRRPPSGTYLNPEFQFVDVSFKKSDRTSYIQQTREPFHASVSPNYNHTPYFPPIVRDHHQQQKTTHTPRFPNEYYGTLARQTHAKDWDEPMDTPKIYKPDAQTRFYDRYIYNVIEKRLAA